MVRIRLQRFIETAFNFSALSSKQLWTLNIGQLESFTFNTSTQPVCVFRSTPPMVPFTSNIQDPSGYSSVGLVYTAQSAAVDLSAITDGSSALYQPTVRPAYGVCMAALLTVDLTSAGYAAAPYLATINVVNVSGYRNLVTADGVPHIARLQGAPTLPNTLITSIYYVQVAQQVSPVTLPFVDPAVDCAGQLFIPYRLVHPTVRPIDQLRALCGAGGWRGGRRLVLRRHSSLAEHCSSQWRVEPSAVLSYGQHHSAHRSRPHLSHISAGRLVHHHLRLSHLAHTVRARQ